MTKWRLITPPGAEPQIVSRVLADGAHESCLVTAQDYVDWVAAGNEPDPYVVPEAEPYRLFKTTLWVRLSNADAETVMAAKALQPAKFRGIWDDAQIIESDSEFFDALKAFLSATLNAEKAEALLQPES